MGANLTSQPHILFADDDPDIRDLVQFHLNVAGYRVSAIDNSAEVLQLVRTERFDAVVLDNWMPETTGIDLCCQIRKFDQSTPILICSGAIEQADIEAAALAGAQGYVRKPFTGRDLIRALRSCLKTLELDA